MSQLERAATALRERPTAAPPPIEVIQRRAGTLRRRRRVLEAGVIALVVLLLGTAGLAVSAARRGGDQGVFVGEGPAKAPTVSTATYRLGSPVDAATADALQLILESRFGFLGQGDVDVRVDGTEVTITTTAPVDSIDSLVTAPGGFALQKVIGEAPETACRSAGGGYGAPQSMWTSALTGPPRCLYVERSVPLPAHPSPYSTGGESSDGSSYRYEVALTPEASQALVDASSPCAEPVCLPATIAVTTGGAIVDPEAQVTGSMTDTGLEVRIVMTDLSSPADAQRIASVLVRPLPGGVVLTRVDPEPSATTTAGSSPTETTGRTAAGTAATGETAIYHLPSSLDPATAEALKQAIQARFRWFGQGDAEVEVDGAEVSVTTQAPADRRDALVTLPGGFELRVIDGEADPAACASNGGGGSGALMSSSLSGPPRCLETSPGPALPDPAAFESGSQWMSANRYEATIGLNGEASQAVIDRWPTCAIRPCLADSVAIVTGGVILHPGAGLRSTEQDGAPRIQVAIPGFTDPAEAQIWASVLIHPLPAGVSLRP